jgi:hypothetical protein
VIRTGLPPVRLHDLRHLAASLTYRATKDLELTSQMPGHASTAITEQVYTSVFEDVEREVASLVPRAHRRRCAHRAHPWGVWVPAASREDETEGETRWGGWGSNPRPRDYESHALTG